MFNAEITLASATALSLGIAIQNFPEGAILSLPLHAKGVSKKKAFCAGVLSGVVEPVAARVTILTSYVLVPVLPLLLSFAAGAMLYVVVEELIPEMSAGKHSHAGVLAFMAGFTLMMYWMSYLGDEVVGNKTITDIMIVISVICMLHGLIYMFVLFVV